MKKPDYVLHGIRPSLDHNNKIIQLKRSSLKQSAKMKPILLKTDLPTILPESINTNNNVFNNLGQSSIIEDNN